MFYVYMLRERPFDFYWVVVGLFDRYFEEKNPKTYLGQVKSCCKTGVNPVVKQDRAASENNI